MTRDTFIPKYNKRKGNYYDNHNSKFSKVIIDDNLYDSPIDLTLSYSPVIPVNKEYIIIKKDVKTLQDLIDLGKEYDENKDYNISMHILHKLIEPLTLLNEMIGMKQLKQEIIDHILFRIQNLDNTNDMMHTIIYGPPGVGKTEVSRIIGMIYLSMGLLNNKTDVKVDINKFVKVKRSDLVGAYLGQTAKATQKCIDSAKGGIMFIDEVYSLGNKEGKDSFAKECIDTINESLTENKAEYICIIAGYKQDIEDCFLSYNKGLERRFPIRFTICKYTAEELFEIFKKKVNDIKWLLDDKITVEFFKNNYDYFNYFGGDIEVLLMRIKKCHSRRLFNAEGELKLITMKDLEDGFNIFKENKTVNEKSESWKQMFL
jgi:SpoVK/Ycf46/Vps4 family AAA+-type ATPase